MTRQCSAWGAGISYGQTGALEMWNLRMGFFRPATARIRHRRPGRTSQKRPHTVDGTPVVPVWPNRDPGQSHDCQGTDFMPLVNDQAGRPSRQFQWSVGIQRELTSNLSLDCFLCGHRGAWWNSNGGITDPNRSDAGDSLRLTPQSDSAANRSLLVTP